MMLSPKKCTNGSTALRIQVSLWPLTHRLTKASDTTQVRQCSISVATRREMSRCSSESITPDKVHGILEDVKREALQKKEILHWEDELVVEFMIIDIDSWDGAVLEKVVEATNALNIKVLVYHVEVNFIVPPPYRYTLYYDERLASYKNRKGKK